MRLRYNAPVTLTFSLLCTLVVFLDQVAATNLSGQFFSIGPTLDFRAPLQILRLLLHPIGHAGWEHLMSNLAFLLLLGPILEEKHGSAAMALMSAITAVVTGLLNVLLFSTGLLGASGIVFMMILLASFTNFRTGEIPITFVLVVVLYLTKETINALQTDSVSQFAHIVGGAMGSVFGALRPNRRSAA